MQKQISPILNYYKAIAAWSFIITLAITAVYPKLIIALVIKLFLVIVLRFLISDRHIRQRLGFHKISGVSHFKFFAVMYLFDSAVTAIFITVIKHFM